MEKLAAARPFLKFPTGTILDNCLSSHPSLVAHLFPSAVWLKSTQPITQGKKKNTCYSEHDSLPQRVPFRICSSSSCVVTPPGLEIYSRSLLEAQSHYFYSFLRITISSHQVWLMKNPLIWPYLLCFSVELPFQGFKIRLVAVAAFPVAS